MKYWILIITAFWTVFLTCLYLSSLERDYKDALDKASGCEEEIEAVREEYRILIP